MRTIVIALILISFSIGVYVICFQPKLSSDKRIAKLQKEAMALNIWDMVHTIRKNPTDIFGWTWYTKDKTFTNNGVSFSGMDGNYKIEYNELNALWKDGCYLRIFNNRILVYEAKSPRHIKAYIKGDWINEFNEMYKICETALIKSIPYDEDIIKRRWGIN